MRAINLGTDIKVTIPMRFSFKRFIMTCIDVITPRIFVMCNVLKRISVLVNVLSHDKYETKIVSTKSKPVS